MRNPLIVIAAALGMAGPSMAQSVSPAFFADVEGSTHGALPLAAVGRHQQLHGDLNGTPRVVRGLSFRRDGVPHQDARYVARSVELSVLASESAGTPSQTFANNYRTTPVLVLPSGTVQLPDRTAMPQSRPAPFDVTLPFSVPFAYSGTQDLLWEIAVSRVTSSLPYPTDRTSGASQVTYSSWIDRGGGCSDASGTLAFTVTCDTTVIQRPLVTLLYTGLGLQPFQLAAVTLGAPIAPVVIPAWCGSVMVQPMIVYGTMADPLGDFRLIDAGTLGSYPVSQWFDSQAIALDAGPQGPTLRFSNAVRARINPVAPGVPVSFVTANAATAVDGSVVLRSAVIVRIEG